MEDIRTESRSSTFHVGALVALTIVAIWSIATLYLHVFEPLDIDSLEITILTTMAVTCTALIPIYWFRRQWGYPLGVSIYGVILAGGISSITDKGYFFSFSLYNLSVILVYIAAVAGIYCNIRAFNLLPRPEMKKAIPPVVVSLVIILLVAFLVQTNANAIHSYRSFQIQNRIDRQLDGLDTIQEKIRFLVDKGDIPSMVVGIVVDDQLVMAEAFGESDVNTAYSCGSVTKMFTATAIMQLVEQGLIDLDGEASQNLPFTATHPEFPARADHSQTPSHPPVRSQQPEDNPGNLLSRRYTH